MKPKFATLDAAKKEDDLRKRTALLYNGTDKAGEFYRKSFHGLFAYVSHRIPEITDVVHRRRHARGLRLAWAPEAWDAIGVRRRTPESYGKKSMRTRSLAG